MSKAPAYHQAFMREAYALWPTWMCPCGAPGCKPTVEDLARDLWAQSIAGSTPTHAPMVQAFVPTPGRVEPEPTVSGRCRACGSKMEIYEYLAAFLKLRNAPWPECDECLRMLPQ